MLPPCQEDQFGRCARPASFVRNALLDGIELQSGGQPNPFKLGIKGWIEDGEQRHEVLDVVCSGGREPDESGRCAPTAATVDLSNCERSDETGAAELQTTFSDPGFDAEQAAFYYVRVLENPQCRWTTHLANAAGLSPPSDVPATAQERGWSSPIWVGGSP